ncbi:MAG TPA: amino acid adenylation domain-containing protein, partial [Thermoanaerobaculia bacterium]|nr:amino acid adenylation domain-containing protein [Thermoanaerobaculia bacterium]
MGLGYLGRPDLSAERFLPDPCGPPGSRLYRSGDLARRLPGGDVEYLGRIDQQVKIRGFRIELGEIEAALLRHPALREAVVVTWEPDKGRPEERRLVAYAVVHEGVEAPGLSDVRQLLSRALPDYMLPSALILLPAFPLTPNGKLDRRALPAPEASRSAASASFVAPRNGLESFLAEIWREVLGLEAVGVHDDFFELGGNSILGAVLVNRLQEELGEILHVVAIFDAPTIALLAELLGRECPRAVAARLGSLAAGAGMAASAPAARLGEAEAAEVRRLIRPLRPLPAGEPRNPQAVFVLAPPRSGTTLLRVMLGGHPALFSPPELELLSFDTLEERKAAFQGRDSFWLEGLIRAVMEVRGCGPEGARATVEAAERDGWTSLRFYRLLQEWLGGRRLVDKTPSYSLNPSVLERAEQGFADPLYLHLVRHPYGMIASFEEAKLDQIFFRHEHRFSRRELAELIWLVSHRNILGFLAGVPPHRQLAVRFEDLVRDPAHEMGRICGLLGLELHPDMLLPYKDERSRMTDGLHAESRMLGDVKFHRHRGIEAGVAERWRDVYAEDFLGDAARDLAERLGYESGPGHAGGGAVLRRDDGSSGPAPLSPAQERLWFLDQLDPGTATYNVSMAVRLQGSLDVPLLGRSLGEVVRRHGSLRTTFVTREGSPAQVVAAELTLDLPLVDLSALPEPLREAEARRAAKAHAGRPFDLARGSLVRACLVRMEGGEHAASFAAHHIVCDGWSIGVLVRELGEIYAALATGRPSPLPELPVQYVDFARWQRRRLEGDALDRQLAWWRERLAGVPVLQLPSDRPRPALQSFAGSTCGFALTLEVSAALRELGRERGTTVFMTVLAAFQALLSRYSGQDDFAVGSPVAGRNRRELEPLIGFFVNTLVLRAELADTPDLLALLDRVRAAALAAYAHQDVPFERVVQELAPERNLSYTPLFQVMLAFQNAPAATLELPGLTLAPFREELTTSKFDISLTVFDSGPQILGQWVHSTALFDRSTIERWAGHFEVFLAGIVADPRRAASEIPLLTTAEREQMLVAWNRPPVDYAEEGLVHRLFEEVAERTPDAAALVFAGETLGYGELNARANRLAHRLRRLGAGPEVVVGISAERSFEMVVGLLAILKAGGAYLPLDPALPEERLRFMAEDAGIALLLTQEGLAGSLPAGPRLVLLDREDLAAENAANPDVPLAPGNAAYVIYTSGSTGRPKGVVVSHGSLGNRLQYARAGDVLPTDAFLQKTTISFDVSLLEIFAPLAAGGRSVLLPPGGQQDLELLVRTIREQGVTYASFPPSMLYALFEREGFAECTSLRTVITGGETVPSALPGRFYEVLPGADLLNRYGPTETTISVTSWTCERDAAPRTLPIGRPTAKARVYLVDRGFQPVPVGVTGELLLGGACLARGYANRPEKTAEVFLPDPFSGEMGSRLYRTGDLARYRPDGALEFAGRVDHQVKIRGFRVELGEIESALASHPAVREVAVIDVEEGASRSLAAYLVLQAGEEAPAGELRRFLLAKLPAYMVPADFVVLEALPLSPTGKVDRRVLPEPGRRGTEAVFEPPRTLTGELVAGLWAGLLRRERIGARDNFFELGGHSLLATQVASRVREVLGVDLPLRVLFEKPELAGFAAEVDAAVRAGAGLAAPPMTPVPRGGDLPLSFAQQRLWFLDQLQPGLPTYNLPAAVRLLGRLDVAAFRASLGEVVRRHESLRTTFTVRGGSPVQVIAGELSLDLPLFDLRDLPPDERESAARRIALDVARRPFDLAAGPLVRPVLVRTGDEEHLAVVVMHHIVSDGWSVGVLIR